MEFVYTIIKRNNIRLVAALLVTILFSSFVQARTCVLSMYSDHDSESEMFDLVFKNDPQVDLIKTAQPEDILKCFTSDYSEIVWLSHGSSRSGASDYSAPLVTAEDGSRFPLYLRFFQNLISKINYETLIKVRIEVCNIDYSGKAYDLNVAEENIQIRSTLDLLIRDLKKHGVEVDISPLFGFGKLVLGEDVTRVTYEWLAQNVDRSRLTVWRTEQNFWCDRDSWLGCDRKKVKIAVPIEPMLP